MKPAHSNIGLVTDKRARQRVLQNLRSQRYRERQRAIKQIDGATTVENTATKSQSVDKPSPQGKPAPLTKRYVPRYHRKEGPKSFWAPGLDDHTKYMMRLNGLVVGFVWKTASDGTVYLSGTKVVRSAPATTKKTPIRLYPEGMLNKIVFKVARKAESGNEQDVEQSQTQARDKHVPTGNIQPQNTEKPDNLREDSIEITDTSKSTSKRLPPRKPLTVSRYALYRYFILRCRSMHCMYHGNAKRANAASSSDPAPIVQHASSKRVSVCKASLRITRTLSSQISRLRARLGICTTRVSSSQEQQILDLMSDRSENEDMQDSDGESEESLKLDSLRSSGSRLNLQTFRLEAGYDKLAHTEEAQGYPKTLRVKRQRQRQREEQELLGYDELEDEATRQRSQLRARRYQYLKSTKQSTLHQEEHPSPSKSLVPQIISIESLPGEDLQAVSWDVPTSIDPETSDFFLKHQSAT